MKRRIDLKMYVIFNKHYDVYLQFLDIDEGSKKNFYIKNIYENKNFEKVMMEINNYFINEKQDKFLIDLYLMNNCNFCYDVMINNKNKSEEWLKKIICTDLLLDESDFDIYKEDSRVYLFNKNVLKIVKLIKNKIMKNKRIEFKKTYFSHNKVSFIEKYVLEKYKTTEFGIIVINEISGNYLLFVKEIMNNQDTTLYTNVFNKLEDLINELSLLLKDEIINYFYIDELFYENIMNNIKFNICLENYVFIEDKKDAIS